MCVCVGESDHEANSCAGESDVRYEHITAATDTHTLRVKRRRQIAILVAHASLNITLDTRVDRDFPLVFRVEIFSSLSLFNSIID